ncbi:RNA polymerase sigma factor [Caloranaerobacter ferrireducens]|uniref:RNA polymerase sigma factor n=1 Tax=Caloranaerobacter ferrireducens TaxID=1323370 RepID=UPI00084D11BB|nr:sigma-70 family RNA polymerase sigma factor [Caloranaerobacter ferrireducens]
MKITYEFITGEIVEVDVEQNFSEVIVEIERVEYNSNRRETRRHNSLNAMQEQGIQLADTSADVESEVELIERNDALYNAISKLQLQQRELIKKVYIEEKPIKEIAAEEVVSSPAISRRLNRIYEQLKKHLEKI